MELIDTKVLKAKRYLLWERPGEEAEPRNVQNVQRTQRHSIFQLL